MNLRPGLKKTYNHTVQEMDLATNWQNDVPVLATPVLLWLSELACMKVLDTINLGENIMTVGYSHHSKHLAATVLGEEIIIESTLRTIENRKLTFDLVAADKTQVIFEGVHERFLINREKFIMKIHKKDLTNGYKN